MSSRRPHQSPIDRLHITEARFKDGEGKVIMVQPTHANEKEYLRPGRVAYDPATHHKKLICPGCNVRVDFNKGSGASICGNNLTGQRPHFKKAPGQEHDKNCDLPKIMHAESNSEIDTDKGYRIHLNITLVRERGRAKPAYERAQNGKVIAMDDRLKPQEITVPGENGESKIINRYRESVVVKGVNDILNLMRRGEFERLKDSLVVNNTVLDWKDFAILGPKRMHNLVSRLLNGASHPVLMQVSIDRPGRGRFVESTKVFYERDSRGAHFIIPRVYLDGKGTEKSFPVKGDYLVLGHPRARHDTVSGSYFLSLSLRDVAFAAFYPSEDILREAKANEAKRQAAVKRPDFALT